MYRDSGADLLSTMIQEFQVTAYSWPLLLTSAESAGRITARVAIYSMFPNMRNDSSLAQTPSLRLRRRLFWLLKAFRSIITGSSVCDYVLIILFVCLSARSMVSVSTFHICLYFRNKMHYVSYKQKHYLSSTAGATWEQPWFCHKIM